MSTTRTQSVGGHAHRCNTLEAEDMESPLTTPPSSPVPIEEDSMVDSKIAEQHFCLSYTQPRKWSYLYHLFVKHFFTLALLLLSGWRNSSLLQPVQKGGVHVLSRCAWKIQGHCCSRRHCILLSRLSWTRRSGNRKQWKKGISSLLDESNISDSYFWSILCLSWRVSWPKMNMAHKYLSCQPTLASTLTMGCLPIAR